jgi:hypothetical protein
MAPLTFTSATITSGEVDPVLGDRVHVFTLDGTDHYAVRPSAGYQLAFLGQVLDGGSVKLLQAQVFRDLLGRDGYTALASAHLTRDDLDRLYTILVTLILGTDPDPTPAPAGADGGPPSPTTGGSTTTPGTSTPTSPSAA